MCGEHLHSVYGMKTLTATAAVLLLAARSGAQSANEGDGKQRGLDGCPPCNANGNDDLNSGSMCNPLCISPSTASIFNFHLHIAAITDILFIIAILISDTFPQEPCIVSAPPTMSVGTYSLPALPYAYNVSSRALLPLYSPVAKSLRL